MRPILDRATDDSLSFFATKTHTLSTSFCFPRLLALAQNFMSISDWIPKVVRSWC